jgi:hypothetical protein
MPDELYTLEQQIFQTLEILERLLTQLLLFLEQSQPKVLFGLHQVFHLINKFKLIDGALVDIHCNIMAE